MAERADAPKSRRPPSSGNTVSKFAELAGTPVAVSSSAAYAVFDGLFQKALIRHLAGRAGAARDLEENVQRVLESLTVRGGP